MSDTLNISAARSKNFAEVDNYGQSLRPGENFAVFGGRLFPAYDLMQDPFDDEFSICIPASDNDVACSLTFDYHKAIARPGRYSMLDVIYDSVVPTFAPGNGIPDFFRYVIADRPKGDSW